MGTALVQRNMFRTTAADIPAAGLLHEHLAADRRRPAPERPSPVARRRAN